MKKTVVASILFLLMGGAGYFLFHQWRVRTFSERVFPGDTFLYFEMPSIREAKADWPETRLGKALAESPRRETYARLGDRLATSVESLIGADLRPLLQQFTGDASAGMFALPNGRRGLGISLYAKDPEAVRKYLEQKLDPGWRRRDPALRKETVSGGGGVTYYKYSSNTFPLSFQPCYALLEHHLLLAGNEAAMKRLLEARESRATSLRGNDLFRNAKERVDYRRGLLVFLNPALARQSLEKSLPARVRLLWPQVEGITGLSALQYAVWSLRVQGSDFEGRGYVKVSPEAGGLLKALMARAPAKPAGPAFVPESAQFFYSAVLPDFGQMDQEGGDLWMRSWTFLQTLTGIDLRRDFLGTLGDEFIVFSAAPELEQPAAPAVPKTAVAVHLKRPEQFHVMLGRLLSLAASHGLEHSEETYKGAVMTRFQLPFAGFALDPACLFQDPWFSFSSSAPLLKAEVETRAGGHNITGTADYRNVTAGFPEAVNGLSYTRVPAVLQTYAALFERESRTGKPWIHEYGLDQEAAYLATKLPGAASFVVMEPEGVSLFSRSPVPTGFLALPPAVLSLREWLKRSDGRPQAYE